MDEVVKKLKQSLTCSYCSKIYVDPVELPCEDYIFKEQLNAKEVVQGNRIKCSTCSQEFQVKQNDFKSVKSIQKQIENKIYFSKEEISLKQPFLFYYRSRVNVRHRSPFMVQRPSFSIHAFSVHLSLFFQIFIE